MWSGAWNKRKLTSEISNRFLPSWVGRAFHTYRSISKMVFRRFRFTLKPLHRDTYLKIYFGHFWNMVIYDNSREGMGTSKKIDHFRKSKISQNWWPTLLYLDLTYSAQVGYMIGQFWGDAMHLTATVGNQIEDILSLTCSWWVKGYLPFTYLIKNLSIGDS